jgi:hypothetical protein
MAAASPVNGGCKSVAAWRALLVASVIGATAWPAYGHGGLSMEKDMCKLRVGAYAMHFTGYQPEVSGVTEFCEDIPKTGHTVVALDAVDDALRAIPIEVRIIRDTGEERDLDAITVLRLPPKLYPTGSVSFELVFDKPGKFVGLVTAGDKGQYASRFPFSVAGTGALVGRYLPLLGLLAGCVALYLYSGRGGPGKRGGSRAGSAA